MYKLNRVKKNGERELVGYFNDPAEDGCAIDEDDKKFDDEAVYEMIRLDDDEQNH